jgi:hypothetical protein
MDGAEYPRIEFTFNKWGYEHACGVINNEINRRK